MTVRVPTPEAGASRTERCTSGTFLSRALRAAVVGLALVSSPLVGVVHAEDTTDGALTAKALIAKVEQTYATVQTIEAKFVQTAFNEVLGDSTEEGTLAIKRPHFMRWAFGTEKLFVSNGQKMWIYTAQDKQVIEYDDISSGKDAANSLLTQLDKVDELFVVEVLASSASEHVLSLSPRDAATSQFKTVKLVLDGAMSPKQVEIVDPFGQVTRLTLTEVKLNTPMADSVFEFSAPTGVDVVKATTN